MNELNPMYEIYTIQSEDVINSLINDNVYKANLDLRRERKSLYEPELSLLKGNCPIWGFINDYKKYKYDINNENLAEFIGSYLYETSRTPDDLWQLNGMYLINYKSDDVYWGVTGNKNSRVVITDSIIKENIVDILWIVVEDYQVFLIGVEGQVIANAVIYETVDTSNIRLEKEYDVEYIPVTNNKLIRYLNDLDVDYIIAGGLALNNKYNNKTNLPTVLLVEDDLDLIDEIEDYLEYIGDTTKVTFLPNIGKTEYEYGIDDEKYAVLSDNIPHILSKNGCSEEIENFIKDNPNIIDPTLLNLTKFDKNIKDMMDRIFV